ncbi:type I polyketide synthase [Nostoc commune]|uniref:type I polyketide synthase n=1 Tax=Nostoc commune TaxID=1178 RepID=UPI0018C8278D|nr:type I polyketide synthase [Nostoc commune]MBG1259424.1 acyltransferase domain-containing protein [Nostoc commune BAE]
MNAQNQEQLHSQLQRVPIAIIGMSALFPKAKNLQEYWDNIIGKVDCITDIPTSRWNIDDYYDPDPTVPDKTYCKRGGFIPDIDFNPLEFGLPPNILEVTDVAQLLSLVVAKAAMEDAGYGDSSNFSRERTGVVLGVVGGCMQLITPLTSRLQYPVWQKVLKSSGLSDEDTEKIIQKMKLAYVGWEENSFPGWLANVVAGRIANRLNLGGMNCVVDAACASSMSAVKMSISELLEGRCDMMITGGVEADNSIFNYMCFSKTPASSKKDFLNPFDAESDGMMVGEGIGMLVLKRLADAERDRDRIYAVIKGIGAGSDGKYKSIYAPRKEGQAKTLRRAYEDAGIPYTSIELIEAHGTGTPAGDLCEFTALNEVFSENNPNKQHIALGSVKSQIGHTKAAAGSASMIKAALAIYHKVLPPTINVTQPNPKFGMENSPFYLNTEVRPWLQSDPNTPRRAGVSSFGFGGTNYHLVLEEYNKEQSDAYRIHTAPRSVLIWADTPEQLLVKCEAAKLQLESATANQYYQELINSCKSSDIPIPSARVGFIAVSQVEAGELLQVVINQLKKQPQAASWEHPRGVYYRKSGMSLKGKVVALFPGQGSQYLNMGSKLAINFPPLRQAYKSLDDLFIQDSLQALSQTVFPRPTFDSEEKTSQTKALQRTENAQAAIGAFSAGLYKILQQAGFKADFVAGHSFGELTALWAAGVLSDADYFYLVKARGQAMSKPKNGADCDTGTMLAVNGEIRKIPEIIKGLSHLNIANFNSPNQVVLSGANPEIATIQQILSKRGYSVTPLPVSAAFHTRFVSHACEPFADAVRSIAFNSPKIPVYSNTTGEAYSTNPEIIQKTLESHLLQSVLFEQEIENLYAAGGYCFVEIGPRQILTNFVKTTLGDRPHLAIALNPSREKDSDLQMRQAVMQLRIAGLSLQDIDPYQFEPQTTEVAKGSKVSITLNGSNYVSEKTKATFEKALQDGHKIQPSMLNSAELQQDIQHSLVNQFQNNSVNQSVSSEVINSNTNVTSPESTDINVNVISCQQPESANANAGAVPTEVVTMRSPYTPTDTADSTDSYFIIPIIESNDMLQPISPSRSNIEQIVGTGLEKLLTQFCNHQSEILRVHDQYLKSQAECSQSFFQLMQQQYHVLLGSNNLKSQQIELAPEEIPTNNFVVQTSTPANTVANGTPIDAPQTNLVNNTLTIVPPAKVESSLAETKSVASVETVDRAELFMQVISSKTGYPVTMLNWEINPRADLGIDAVKWMDIISAIQELLPDVPKVNPKELVEQPTLRQVAEYIQICVPQPKSPQVPVSTSANSIETIVPQPVKPTEDTFLTQSLLDVISDKTGYPAEMLETEMDLEADLGVDSIKRVEIIGAMQTLFPNLPKLSPEELGEQRTIGKIANYLGTKITEAKKKFLMPV